MLLWRYGLGLLIGTTLCIAALLGLRFHIPGATPLCIGLQMTSLIIILYDAHLIWKGKLIKTVEGVPIYATLYAAAQMTFFVLGVAIPSGWLVV